MEELRVTLEGSPDFVKELYKLINSPDVKKSKPVSKSSFSDVLRAPIGADEIEQLTQIITLVIVWRAATISVVVDSIKKVLELECFRDEKIRARDPVTGRKKGELTHESSIEKIKKTLES